jgi:hypothetical protein
LLIGFGKHDALPKFKGCGTWDEPHDGFA